MKDLQPVRGTRDLLPETFYQLATVIQCAKDVTETYGFQEMATPIFEFSQVFAPVGETSDIITKETYTFSDRNGESLTLRPEGTASVVRAIISNGLTQQTPLKYFYAGPMFRYDRPQKGRYRQFHQIGVELIGPHQSQADVETIASGYQILDRLGLTEAITLEINSLGDQESRQAYRTVLVGYLQDHKEALSEESKDRLERNPMRILDSKNEGDKKILEKAPSYKESLTPSSLGFFEEVLDGLELLKIPYAVNPKLVRGLDYYCHTAFEFISSRLGAQGTVLAGGRYDGLVKSLGGPDLAGIGWAGGVERLALLANPVYSPRHPIVLIPLGDEAQKMALQIAHALRKMGLYVEQGYSGNMSKRLKKADKQNASHVVILGEEELAKKAVLIRNLDSGTQDLVNLDAIGDYFSTKEPHESRSKTQSSIGTP